MARVSIMKMLMVFAATAMLVDMAMAVDYTVGSPNEGWDLSTDLPTWASSQTFSVGDNLVFYEKVVISSLHRLMMFLKSLGKTMILVDSDLQ
ncbi:uclacyanin 1-like protein, partial [Tanacetum coccineum]